MTTRRHPGRFAALLPLLLSSHTASAGDLPMLDCVIEPYEVVDVASAAEGVLERIHVERNDLVERGQVIAEMEAEVEKASLAFARLNASLTSEIQLRRADFEFNERNRDRIKTLYVKQAIPLHHKDEAETDAAKSGWLWHKAQDDKQLAALELARARAVVTRRTIVSPISGVVVARHKSVGEYVEDQAIVTVAQVHPLRVDVIAPVELFGSIIEGTQAEIFPELVSTGTYHARVLSVDRVIDGASGTFDVRLELPNPDYAIPSGLKCQVAFSAVPAPAGEFPNGDPPGKASEPPAPGDAPATPAIRAGVDAAGGLVNAAGPSRTPEVAISAISR